MDVISVCDKTDVWAVGVLFLDMLSKLKLSSTFKAMHQSFISPDVHASEMILEYANLKKYEREQLFGLLGIEQLFTGDVQQAEKQQALFQVIHGMIERVPSKRVSAIDLLK